MRWRFSNSLRDSKYTFLSKLFRNIWWSIGQLPQLKHMDNFFTMGKVSCGFLWTISRRIGRVWSQVIEFPRSVCKLPNVGLGTELTTLCIIPGTSQAFDGYVFNQRIFAKLWASVHFCFPIYKSENVIYTQITSVYLQGFPLSDWGGLDTFQDWHIKYPS